MCQVRGYSSYPSLNNIKHNKFFKSQIYIHNMPTKVGPMDRKEIYILKECKFDF